MKKKEAIEIIKAELGTKADDKRTKVSKAVTLIEDFIKWDEDIGMLIDGFYKKKFDDSDALFNEYAENWFKRMKADPKKYADFKEYNWGSIDYLIRLAIKMYGMNEACRIYGDKIREVYFDCTDGRTS